jgi:hypothetical protein
MAVRAAIAGQEGKGRSVPDEEIIHQKPTEGAFPVIFFDNDIAKLAQVYSVCKQIELVRVGESAAFATRPTVMNGDYSDLWLGHNINENAYTTLINNPLYPSEHDMFDIYSGMQEREFTIINTWVNRSVGPRTAVFDWDRTLTMVEGIRLGQVPPGIIRETVAQYYPGLVPVNYVEDMLIYLCGGLQRLKSLRNMFVYLRANSIDIKILTNNPAAGNPRSTSLFKELVNTLVAIPGYDVEVWCSYFPPYNGDKGMVMREKFPALCGMAGGRRRRHKTVRGRVVRRRKSRRSK